jgi:hypothetical protein
MKYVLLIKKFAIWMKLWRKLRNELEEKLTGDQTLKGSWQAEFKRRALLFLVSKQNLNPSYRHIWHIKNDPTK